MATFPVNIFFGIHSETVPPASRCIAGLQCIILVSTACRCGIRGVPGPEIIHVKEFKTVQDLLESVKKCGAVSVPASQIRDIFGFGRLGVHVRNQISEELEKAGLTHYPDVFPGNQYTFVRVVQTNSPVDQIIQAAVNQSPKTDSILIEAAQASTRLEALREAIGSKISA